MEDMLDTTAGGYPFPPHMTSLQEINWVFEPYRRFRVSGGVDRKSAVEFMGVITDVGFRIIMHITGHGQAIELDTTYDVLRKERSWAMVREVGINARTGMFGDGITAFVSVRERPDGRFVYTIGRQSIFIPFDVPRILATLNQVEGADSHDSWGGANTIGGSPRVQGSRLPPDKVAEIVNSIVS